MMLVWAMLYVVVIALIGAAITSLILQRQTGRSIPELVGLVLALGAGTCATLLLWISMLGIRPGRGVILLLGGVAVSILVGLAILRRLPRPALPMWERKSSSLLILLPAAVLLLANLYVFIPAVGFRIFEWDAFSIWGLKAKVLFESSLNPRPDYFTDVRFSFSHLDYPLLLPVLLTGGFAMLGETDDTTGKIVLPFLITAQICLAYTGARLWLGRLASLLITMLLVCIPLHLARAGIGTADGPLAGFWLGSLVYLMRWMRTSDAPDLLIMGLFVLFTATTKSEGLPLAMLGTLIVIGISARNRSWRPAIGFMAIAWTGIGIWLAWKAGIPRTDENYFGRLRPGIILENLARLGTIIPMIAKSLVRVDRWGGLWILLPLLAVLGWRAFSERRTLWLWTIFLAHLMLYTLAYIITPWDNLKALIDASLERLLLHIAPTAMLLVAAHWAECTPPRSGAQADGTAH